MPGPWEVELGGGIARLNLAGYKAGHLPSGPNRYAFGGLTDQAFLALELLERGGNAG